MQQVTSDRILSSKMMATRSGLASQRAALGEIGNKVSKITLDPTKKTVIKNGWVDPVTNKQKTLSKSKATTSLKVLAEEDTFKKPVRQLRNEFSFVFKPMNFNAVKLNI